MTGAILLFNDECGVCRRIARWVRATADATLVVQPIGNDPDALTALHPGLDIWDAYATIHLVMPDGTMRTGGEAVAEVFRRLPNTRWFAGLFRFRALQLLLNVAYWLLAATRPIFGCESCGTPARWMRPFVWIGHVAKLVFGKRVHARPRYSRTDA